MEKLFSKDQLKEMVLDRASWLKELKKVNLFDIDRETAVMVFNFEYYTHRKNRFTKAQMVQAIKTLDELRAAAL